MNRLARTVAIACVGILLARSSHASKILDVPSGGYGRIADFYEAVSEIDPNACQQILISLNREYVIGDDAVDAYPRVSLATDSFLWSDLQIPWMRKLVQNVDTHDPREVDMGGPQALNLTQVKIAGQTLTIFRQDVEKYSEEWGATLSISRLWISNHSLPSFPSGRYLTQSDLRLISGSEILLGLPDHLPRGSKQANLAVNPKSSRSAKPLLLNALIVNGDLYLLAIDAGEAEVHAPRGGDGTVEVYVLKFHSATDVRPASLFRSL